MRQKEMERAAFIQQLTLPGNLTTTQRMCTVVCRLLSPLEKIAYKYRKISGEQWISTALFRFGRYLSFSSRGRFLESNKEPSTGSCQSPIPEL